MKTLGKMKLNQFSKNELDQRKLNALKGGCACTYGCSNCGNCPSSGGSAGFEFGTMIGTTWAPNNMGSGSSEY